MKLTILGATGRTGQHLLQQALAAGHEVTALVRNPAKLQVQHERLTVITGQVQDKARVAQAVAGADVVLSVLGPTSNTPDYQVSRGAQRVIEAMQAAGVRRLVISAGAGVGDPNDAPKLINKIINLLLKLVSRHVYEDMVRTVELVRQSDLEWTVVRVPMLTDDPATGDVKVAYVGKGMGMRLSRADLAAFMLKTAETGAYGRQAPAISSRRGMETSAT